MSSILSNLFSSTESSLINCTASCAGGVVILTDFRVRGTSEVAANLRAFCTVLAKLSPKAWSLRKCCIS